MKNYFNTESKYSSMKGLDASLSLVIMLMVSILVILTLGNILANNISGLEEFISLNMPIEGLIP